MIITRALQQFVVFFASQRNTIAITGRSYPQHCKTRLCQELCRCCRGMIEWFTILLAMVLAAWAPTGQAVGANLNLTAMPWHAYIGAGCSVRTAPSDAGTRSYIFNCNGKSEAFPHISLQNTGPRDWRGFNRLLLKMRLISTDTGIRAGGEHVTVCLYDGNYRHENLPGDPPVQQVVGNFKLCTGGWQTLKLNLNGVARSNVLGIDVYVYEMPYAYPHMFEVQIAQAILTGPDADQICFDSHVFSANALHGESGRSVGTLKTADGLDLQIGSMGGVRRWLINGAAFGTGRRQPSGFMLRDAAADSPPIMVGGRVVAKGRRIVQEGVVKKLGLKLHAVYTVKGDMITVRGKVTNLRGGTRAVTVYFGIPVNLLNWRWDEGLEKPTHPFRYIHAIPSLEEVVTGYPVCALSTTGAGLAMGIRLDQPTVYRFVINPHQHLLYIAFNFALLDGMRWNKKPLSSARFSFIIYRCNPQWGLRSALERYYHFFPQFFVNHVARGGGWDFPFGRAQAKQTSKQLLAGGYRFDWGVVRKDARWNHDHGALNLLYIEPEFLQLSMGDFQKPTYQEAMNFFMALIHGNNDAWAKFMKLPYTKGHCGHFWSKQYSGMELRSFLTALLKAARTSGMYSTNGKLILGIHTAPWLDDNGVGAMIPCDLSPNIPDGLGKFDYYHCMLPNIRAFDYTMGFPADGFALDSFDSTPNDYCQAHFQYSKFPLSFNPRTDEPMIPATFSTVQWLKWLSPMCHKQHEILMTNIDDQNVTFSAPYIDIFANESPVVTRPVLLRVLAYHRPITYLPYSNQPKAGVQYNLLWDDYPGRGIKLSVLAPMVPVLDKLYQAGWEPVTWAHSTYPAICIERYGHGDICYLSLYNPTDNTVQAQINVDWSRLGIQRSSVRMIYPKKQYLSQHGNGFAITMQSRETTVVYLR